MQLARQLSEAIRLSKWALFPNLVPVKRLKELVPHLRFVEPLQDYDCISLDFAEKFHLCPGGVHAGVDYDLIRNGVILTPELYAVADGHIEKQGLLSDGTGFLTLRLKTPYRDEPVWAIYYHVATKFLDVGTQVAAGDMIGRMDTGAAGSLSTGHHLHLQANYGQKWWNYTFNPHKFGLPGGSDGVP